jgi:penicillin-binding protein 1A
MPYERKHHKGSWSPFEELVPENSRRSGSFWQRQRWWILLVILVVLFLGGGGGGLWYLARDLPSIESLKSYQPSLTTRVYSDDNRLIGQFFIEKRVMVPLDRLPEDLIHAVIAVEDSRFYEHRGFDLYGITRAAVANLHSMKIKQGASTITQQLARSLFLTPERNIQRKLKEILLALKIEKLLTKEEILEMYLNQIYFGHGAYGVQAAARTYFGKDVGQINLAEAAFLSGIPKAPRDYSPYLSPQRAKQRQGIALRRMLEEGFINEAEYRTAYQQDLYFQKLRQDQEISPYFLEYVRQRLISTYGAELVYRGGLNVYTTLNVEMQMAANQAVSEGLRALDKRQGFRGPIDHELIEEQTQPPTERGGSMTTAGEPQEGELVEGVVTQVESDHVLINVSGFTGELLLEDMIWAKRRLRGQRVEEVEVLENPTPGDLLKVGDVVKAMMKKKDPKTGELFFALDQDPQAEIALLAIDPRTGDIKTMVGGYDFNRSEFNRAILAKRQPGSAFKPMIYAAAIERGLTPSTILLDSPVIFTDPVSQKTWKPTNYEERFYGPISLRDALVHSRNVATIKLLEKVGIQNVIEFSHRVGITSPLTPDLSLALGSSSLSLIELVSAYGVLANQGIRLEPMEIRSVTDSEGNILEYHEPTAQPVLSPEVAYIATSMLQDVIQRGTGKRARDLGHSLAGKTGTTNDFTDAWFMGFTPNLVTGVWVGFDDRKSLGDREAGGRTALPIWIQFMGEALKQIPEMNFRIPDNVVFAKVNPQTGKRALPGDPEARVEIFLKGKQPPPSTQTRPSVVDFYRMDHATEDHSL